MRLEYTAPYDWGGVLSFLRARATPGVEDVDDRRYQRTTTTGAIRVTHAPGESSIRVDIADHDSRAIDRLRRLFDVAADPAAIGRHLGADPLLSDRLRANAGIRVPGAWDPFELCVRAILGQQITVRAATTIAGRIAARWGEAVAETPGLTRAFPTAPQLAEARIEEAGVIRVRAAAIRAVARAMCDGTLTFDGNGTLEALRAIPGVGNWTAQYIAMRALKDADAFPSGDVVLRRMAGGLSTRALDERAKAWRPYRAYAVMLLWQAAAAAQP